MPNQKPKHFLSAELWPFLLVFVAVLSLSSARSGAQSAAGADPTANRTLDAVALPSGAKPPMIDGDLSDPCWLTAAHASVFYDPLAGTKAPDQTESAICYDKQCLYVSFCCHDSQPETITARETVRDADMSSDDSVRLELDPFRTYNRGDFAIFVVNARGTRSTYLGGGRAGKLEWQGEWAAAVRRVPDGWTVEMRIPWSILSYPRRVGALTMGINFRRNQPRRRVESHWSNLGPQFYREREGFWKGVIAPARAWQPQISTLPYLIAGAGAGGGIGRLRGGIDTRIQATPELTAVATFNPDFASVEGSVESIAFTRGERYVPDRRPFFLEGRDYRSLGEDYQIGQLFDSAKITQVDTGVNLYGKIAPRTTLGMVGTIAMGSQANFVSQIRQQINATSSANLMLLQRLAPGEDNTVVAFAPQFRRGKWEAEGQLVQTLGQQAGGMGWTGAINLQDKNLFTNLRYRRVGSTFVDRLGLIGFNDYQGWTSYTDWGAQWRHGKLRSFDISFSPTFDSHLDGRPFRRRASLGAYFETRSDYNFGVNIDGGKFDQDTDFTYGAFFGGGISNRFRQWGMSFTAGQLANLPYTSFGPSWSARVFHRLDLNVSSFVQNYQGVSQQHIVTFNYELSPNRSWGGRMVLQDHSMNFYLSYRNAGRRGTDTYFILGDPNTARFVPSLNVKMVYSL